MDTKHRDTPNPLPDDLSVERAIAIWFEGHPRSEAPAYVPTDVSLYAPGEFHGVMPRPAHRRRHRPVCVR